jgi:hypothetical protein
MKTPTAYTLSHTTSTGSVYDSTRRAAGPAIPKPGAFQSNAALVLTRLEADQIARNGREVSEYLLDAALRAYHLDPNQITDKLWAIRATYWGSDG